MNIHPMEKITVDRIPCGDHTVCFNDHADVSGVYGNDSEICQCDQCYDDIVINHNDAAYGASVS